MVNIYVIQGTIWNILYIYNAYVLPGIFILLLLNWKYAIYELVISELYCSRKPEYPEKTTNLSQVCHAVSFLLH
jgi:hypothetical protein